MYILKDVLADYLNIFHSIENQVTVILSCVLSPSVCQDASVLLLSGHTFGKDSKDLEEKNLLLLWYPDSQPQVCQVFEGAHIRCGLSKARQIILLFVKLLCFLKAYLRVDFQGLTFTQTLKSSSSEITFVIRVLIFGQLCNQNFIFQTSDHFCFFIASVCSTKQQLQLQQLSIKSLYQLEKCYPFNLGQTFRIYFSKNTGQSHGVIQVGKDLEDQVQLLTENY